MSFWRHNICETCWHQLHGNDSVPMHLIPQLREEVKCCFCGKLNKDGIYCRENGKRLPCNGHCR
jgi:hypothetical protein